MKYRTKLYLALAGTACISTLSGFGVLFYTFRDHAFKDEQTKVITVAATTAALIDPELLKGMNARPDEQTAQYTTLKSQLIKARNANRREQIYIKFLYTLKPNPNNPEQLIFLVDAEEDPRALSHVGDIDNSAYTSDIIHNLGIYYSPKKFISDIWGDWISGFAPIYDKEGNYVATVGADISMQRYLVDIHRILQLFGIGFLVSLCLAFAGGYWLSFRVSFAITHLLCCVREIGEGNLQCQAALHTHDEFEELGSEINRMTLGLQDRERLKLNFARYVSDHVMQKILQKEPITPFEAGRCKTTLLIADIRQLTQLSDRVPPKQIIAQLNTYFGTMLDVIFHYQGTFDKFLGDSLMVAFGVPLEDENQEEHAVLAALGMQQALEKLNQTWAEQKKPMIEVGIGIHTGLAVIGNIGSENRIEFTVLGDTVNVATALGTATKTLGKKILVSEMTYHNIKGKFRAASLEPLTLPGRKEALNIYVIEV